MGEVDQNPHSSLARIIQEIHADGLMSSDLMIASFFRICIDICVIKYHAMTVEANDLFVPSTPNLPSTRLDVLNDLTVPSIQPHPTQM
ncbi:unnamed protein product, partial [Mesorhabditis spiculigera]